LIGGKKKKEKSDRRPEFGVFDGGGKKRKDGPISLHTRREKRGGTRNETQHSSDEERKIKGVYFAGKKRSGAEEYSACLGEEYEAEGRPTLF